ncbi:MAG: hypothetical protein ACK5DE_14020 [Bacteroidota bacterium]|jgi:hypothetical protein
MYLKFIDSDSVVYLINDKDREIRYRVKPDTFANKWCVHEIDFYTQDFMVDGQVVTFALPW